MSDRDARDILRGRAGWTEHIKMMIENREPPDEAPRRRLSITRLQRQTDAATELIALCQTVTEDGSLAVRRWLWRVRRCATTKRLMPALPSASRAGGD